MALVTVLLGLLLAGNYLWAPQPALVDYRNACPSADVVGHAAAVMQSTVDKNEADTTTWKKTAKVSPSKFPSEINASYKFVVLENNATQNETVYKLTIHFTGVENDPAIAYAYPHSGASMLDSEGAVFGLHKHAVSEISLRFRAKQGAGGVALVTCQNHRQSTVSIDLPGYAL